MTMYQQTHDNRNDTAATIDFKEPMAATECFILRRPLNARR